MAVELEKRARLHPGVRDVYRDLADRVRELGGPDELTSGRPVLPFDPSTREIGKAITKDKVYRAAGLFVLNAARWLSATEENMPKVIERVAGGGRIRYRVAFEAKEIVLTGRELELLDFFVYHHNEVFSSEQIGEVALGGLDANEARTSVSRLRAKIEDDPSKPTRLVRVGKEGHGYMYRRPSRNRRR